VVKPDFLGIGAMKAGTTWLNYHLNNHPYIWVPPIKELRFFSQLSGHKKNVLLQTITHKWLRTELKKRSRSYLQRTSGFKDLLWDLHYFLHMPNEKWYTNCFRPDLDQICGEFSTDYAVLNEKKIQRIRMCYPNLKILYILRNPIDRTWSHIRMMQSSKNQIQLDYQDLKKLMQFMKDNSWIVQHSLYGANLTNWRLHFPASQIFVGFFDDIQSRPKELLSEIFNFLNVDPHEINNIKDISRPINPSLKQEMPTEFTKYLAALFHDDLISMHKQYGNYCTQWLHEAERQLI